MSNKTLRQLAQTALDVQNACNLSGVAHSFAEACSALRRLPDSASTEGCNKHPIVTLYLDKLTQLNGGFYDSKTLDVMRCFDWAEKQAKTDDVVPLPERK